MMFLHLSNALLTVMFWISIVYNVLLTFLTLAEVFATLINVCMLFSYFVNFRAYCVSKGIPDQILSVTKIEKS